MESEQAPGGPVTTTEQRARQGLFVSPSYVGTMEKANLGAVMNIRVPVDLKREALKRADRAGKSLSDWARDVMQKETQPREQEHAA